MLKAYGFFSIHQRALLVPSLYQLSKTPRCYQQTKTTKSVINSTSESKSHLPSTNLATGFIFYVILRELFSKKSPNGVYDDAFKICINDDRVKDLFGSHIKGHGETNRRGRRRHTAHQSWYDDKQHLHMAMRFHLKGTMGTGVVHLEVAENDAKEFEYRYLIVETDGGFSKKHIILRSTDPVPA